MAYRTKWEALADRDVRKQFASSMAVKFRQLFKDFEDIEMEWWLFRKAMISSAVGSCEQKRLRMAVGNEKRTPWWNLDIKEAIRAKVNAFKALLQNRSSSDLRSRYWKAQKAAALAVKTSKNVLGRSLVVGWIPTIYRQTKHFSWPFSACVRKV